MVPGANEGLPNSLSSGNRPDDRRQTSTVSVNGQNDVVNNNLIDGMDNNERFIGTIGVRPSVDAIAEVKVQTNMYTAETGRTAGAVREHPDQVGHQRLPRLGLRVLPQREVRLLRLLRPPRSGRSRSCASSSGAAASAAASSGTGRSSSPTTSATTRSAARPSSAPCRRRRCATATSRSCWRRGIVIYDPLTSPRTPFPGNVIPANRIDPIGAEVLQPVSRCRRPPGLGSNFTTDGEPRADVGHLRRAPRPPLHRQPHPLRALLGQRRRDAGARRVRHRRRHRPGRVGGRLRRPLAGRRLGAARQLPRDHQADAAVRGQGRQAVLQHRVAARDLRPEHRDLVRPAGHQHRRPDVGPAELRRGRLHDARRSAVRADPAQEQHLAGAGRRSPTSAARTTCAPASPSCAGRWRRSRATTAPGSTPSPPRPPTTAPAPAATRRRRSCSAIRSPWRGRTWSSTPPWRRGSRASSSRTTGAPTTG